MGQNVFQMYHGEVQEPSFVIWLCICLPVPTRRFTFVEKYLPTVLHGNQVYHGTPMTPKKMLEAIPSTIQTAGAAAPASQPPGESKKHQRCARVGCRRIALRGLKSHEELDHFCKHHDEVDPNYCCWKCQYKDEGKQCGKGHSAQCTKKILTKPSGNT